MAEPRPNAARSGMKPHRTGFHHVRSPELFARYPLIGLVMFVVGSVVFALFAHSLVNDGPLVESDITWANNLHATAREAPGWVSDVMIAAYFVGNQVVAAIGIALGIYFLRKRYWRELLMVINGFGVSALLFVLLSNIFDRPRPYFETPIWRAHPIPGFPSGHAIAVISSYGLLLYFYVPKIASRTRRAWVLTGMLALALYILYSRAFLGDHFVSDLVAGCAVGMAWSGLAHTVVELSFRKRKHVEATPRAGVALPR